MLPSNFKKHPYNSVMNKSEAKTIALNIMVILSRTGDEFRPLSWDEYKEERLKDGGFTEGEKSYFDKVAPWCRSGEQAATFSPVWRRRLEASEMNWTPEQRLKLINAVAEKSFDVTVDEGQQLLRLIQRIMFLCDMPGRWLERNEWIYKDSLLTDKTTNIQETRNERTT